MFTGIVERMGKIVSTKRLNGKTYEILIKLGKTLKHIHVGDSIAVNGACLTLVGKRGNNAKFEVMNETLARTNLGTLNPNSEVNIEESMSLKDKISGHFVTGHIDGTGRVSKVKRQNDGSVEMTIRADGKLTSMMVEKGSVALDGVSLTLVHVKQREFSVCLIPHTLKVTALGTKKIGDHVNIEADYVGKYILKLGTKYAR